jgi:2-polyprenyl-3-methyl-5-hydroxy-6-metoxy-1,4-benzoquinol methylase
MLPLANSYLTADELNKVESFYPLRVRVCDECFLVQAEDFESPEAIFTDYAYLSSYSDSWLQHARSYAERVLERFRLSSRSQVVEVASNDGYLLQYFVAKGIPVLGIEPAANVAEIAIRKGIPTRNSFFGQETAKQLIAEGFRADLLVGNNVLAHVPKTNDFVRGLKLLLKPEGVITMEFPHLLRLMAEGQFDTIYHEHFSYFSFLTVEKIFKQQELRIFDVEELPTHGGSLRIYACHASDDSKQVAQAVPRLVEKESAFGIHRADTYLSFAERIKETKRSLLEFLIRIKKEGKSVVGYGAPAKGNTLLNYCGIRTDFVDYTVDRNPSKQGRFLPGTHIPIYHPDKIRETKPDFLLVLPWNLIVEIKQQMSHIREWGGQFVTPIPEVTVF